MSDVLEYKYVDLPEAKASAGAIPLVVTAELNALTDEGWQVEQMINSRVIGKVGFLLSRDA